MNISQLFEESQEIILGVPIFVNTVYMYVLYLLYVLLLSGMTEASSFNAFVNCSAALRRVQRPRCLRGDPASKRRSCERARRGGLHPLYYSLTLQHRDCTAVLLRHGANPNTIDTKKRRPVAIIVI